jgi:hypothetical protein
MVGIMTFDEAIRTALLDWCARPVRYGIDDCCLAAANIYVEVLGVDPAAGWRGRYRTRRGAQRLLGKEGIIGTLATAAKEQGWRRIRPAAAMTGDLGIIRTAEGPAVAIRYAGRWHNHVDYGFVAVEQAVIAWSVT